QMRRKKSLFGVHDQAVLVQLRPRERRPPWPKFIERSPGSLGKGRSLHRFFDILRTIPAADAVRILCHFRLPQADTNMADSPDSADDAALAAALQFAESLASQPSTLVAHPHPTHGGS
ncbi:hypothetical protein LTR72_012108, partial [Exophiala xenobiotica]